MTMPRQSALPRRHQPARALALAVAAVLAIVLPGAAISSGASFTFDPAILLAMRDAGGGSASTPAGPDWLPGVMLAVTVLGTDKVLLPSALLCAVLLVVRQRRISAALLAGCAITSPLAVQLFKHQFGRARPEVIDHLIAIGSPSFPSGHATNTASIFLACALTLGRLTPLRAHRTGLAVLAALLAFITGLSRVYLGVHWPSDVLAGWSFGALWALAWCALDNRPRGPAEENSG